MASERVVARLDGDEGSFVIQHGGLADGDVVSAFGSIVPHSGAGGLSTIRGRAREPEMGVLKLTVTL